jgi:serine phosphatase RsbU (regulator of sigma subunit)
MPITKNNFLKSLCFCGLILLLHCYSASGHVKLNFIGELNKKGDTIPHLNLFYTLRWNITVIYPDQAKAIFNNSKADSLLSNVKNIESAILTTNFAVSKSLLNKIHVIRYSLRGSVKILINKQCVLQTGIFALSNQDDLHYQRQTSFLPLIFPDEKISVVVIYIPPVLNPRWNLQLELGERKWANSGEDQRIADKNEAYGIGAFYLSFAFIFFFLFLFFRSNRENLYFSLFCISAALSFFIDTNEHSLYAKFVANFVMAFSIEFLAIFLSKVLLYNERTKIPLLIIGILTAIFFHPTLLFKTDVGLGLSIPNICFISLIVYSGFSVLYYLIQGLWQKKWEAKTIAIGSLAGLLLQVFIPIILAITFSTRLNNSETLQSIFNLSAVLGLFVYPVVVAFVLGKRNGLIQHQLIHQITAIEKLSQENLEKETEKKKILEQQNVQLELKVAGRTKELELKNEVITLKNKEITDSLVYAKRIQAAILPDSKLIYKSLKQAFILYLPKDIVSGDFYAFAQKNNKVIIAAADCTGHGVAGALMSMIGSSLLNQIINERDVTSPGKILDELNTGIIHSLKQKDSESNDGMDIAVCSFDFSNSKVIFSGANRPLWLVRKNELLTYKPNKLPIGGLQITHNEKFIEHEITLEPNDTIYLFSDGYADQFGGGAGKKMMLKRFKETILAIQNKTMQEQEINLKDFFLDWKKNNEQVDDVLVVGIRV